MDDPLNGYEKEPFSAEGKTRDLYRIGSGPAVIVMAEIPGITPKVAEFGRKVAGIGCSAVLPHLFGTPGREPSAGAMFASILPACIAREFTVLATGRTSPVISWLRALVRAEHERCGGPGVGAVGMCFTGGFALGMMVDDTMVAPVLSQPSLPFAITRAQRRDIGLCEEDLDKVRARARAGTCVLGLRFSEDKMAPRERFARLSEELGDAFIAVEIDSSPGNPYGHPRFAHSVLTEHLQDQPGTPTRQALDQVLDFLAERLVRAGG